MYILVRGTALEIQDKLEGKLPVDINIWEQKEVWVATDPSIAPKLEIKDVPTATPHKITGVEEYLGLQRLSDEIFIQAIKGSAEPWKPESGSSSASGSAE